MPPLRGIVLEMTKAESEEAQVFFEGILHRRTITFAIEVWTTPYSSAVEIASRMQ